MNLSRTMRPGDLDELREELRAVDGILEVLNGGDRQQDPARRWEYAMAYRAYLKAPGFRSTFLRVADYGCATGMLAPLMLSLGHDVSMYEPWSWGDQEEFATWQMEEARRRVGGVASQGTYRWIHRPLDQLTAEDAGYDIAYCISTLEHCQNHAPQFRALCRSVGQTGMLFVTTDFAGHGGFGFYGDNVRPDGMFSKEAYEGLAAIGREEGFDFLGGEPDWGWDESCKMLHGSYGFASLAMVRR